MFNYQLKMEDAPVLRLLDTIIVKGLENRASDIHLEPGEDFNRVRYRIDGVLQQVQRISMDRHAALVSCVKLMAGMDIAEKRVPQDGRTQISHEGKPVDLRVSSLPTITGEKIVIRILDSGTQHLVLDDMGFTKDNIELYRNMYRASYGLILLTGPTGSGKTTTLYATLQELNQPERNIVTIEDPVEYRIAGINQVAVNLKAGMTFARGLRSILRQDPNVIMIGEIRDKETAEISIQAALTGHMVFSTLHTNTAAGAITRLLDMGIEPYLAASALRGIVAQRLVRKLCPYCKQEYVPDPSMWEYKFASDYSRVHTSVEVAKIPQDKAETSCIQCNQNIDYNLYRACGCDQCRKSGYVGRIAIHEMLPVTTDLKKLIISRASEQELWYAAKRAFPCLTTLKEDGLCKVHEGLTSAQELLRILGV